jgi:hypothetical protein
VHRDVSPQNVLVSFDGEVKLIDFGIAKAAGKGRQTQAGILKGKFGYMSPEQVRGLPIDRRSDIFACGIVLYELLTGERLFVGESDFSTLEKVRNVEIIPPSTYNRQDPRELERIVLKALAKDVEDRYQNAIDLHDDLQSFIYTAGEFYSRKDLAAWMKGARRTTSMPAAVPPPMPGAGGAPTRPPPPPTSLRSTQGVPVVPPPASMTMPSMSAAANAAAAAESIGPPKADLNWDDDELETQIYDNPEEEAAAKSGRAPMGAPAAGMVAAAAAPAPAPPPPVDEPDLSELVRSTSKGWGPAAKANGANGSHGPGVNGGGPPAPAFTAGLGTGPISTPSPLFDDRRESSVSGPMARPDSFDPMSTFGSGIVKRERKSRTMLWAALAGVALIAAAVAIVVITSGGDKPASTAKPVEPAPVPAAGTATAPVDDNTGFELFVTPADRGGLAPRQRGPDRVDPGARAQDRARASTGSRSTRRRAS